MPNSVARPKPSLWSVRAPLPASTGRLLGAASLLLVAAAWCALSYVQVSDGHDGTKPLVSHFFLPAPDEV